MGPLGPLWVQPQIRPDQIRLLYSSVDILKNHLSRPCGHGGDRCKQILAFFCLVFYLIEIAIFDKAENS